ncbi:hypothetical protein DEU56DRAFT_724773, partial [Suillus clintonianus]|uniref:uncharacterized protein n=1 Tax=Suillus clintonianus TaxID=1904413 RepID=UPI001B87649B
PTEFDLRRKNAQFANAVRSGKKAVKPSRQDKMAKRSPLSLWALGVVLFVVIGGVLFELARLVFL